MELAKTNNRYTIELGVRDIDQAAISKAIQLVTDEAAAQEDRRDLYDDPLPHGCVARLGSRWLTHPAPVLAGLVEVADVEKGTTRRATQRLAAVRAPQSVHVPFKVRYKAG